MHGIEIRTLRFVIRDFSTADHDGFVAYHTDPAYRALYGDEIASAAKARELLQAFDDWAREEPRRKFQFAVVRGEAPGDLVGCCGLRDEGRGPSVAELGIELAPQNWGRYRWAIEIAEAMLAYGFDVLGLEEIFGRTTDVNSRVARLARWFGASEIATRPGQGWMAVQDINEVEWRIQRAEWQIIRARRTC